MPNRPPFASAVLALLAVALFLPIALAVILGVGGLLAAMGDAAAARVLGWIGFALGVVWVVDLISLVILQAIGSLGARPTDDHESGPD